MSDAQRRGRFARSETQRRFDERDVIFSRRELEAGSERYAAYYARHPARAEIDARFRAAPGLLRPASAAYHDLMFAAADATFDTVDALHADTDGPVAAERTDIGAADLTAFLRGWLLQQGAHSVGVTPLRAEHCYSHHGRGERYGEAITAAHAWALALTVEMDHAMVQRAPGGPIVMESSRQYLRSGFLAVQVARMLRALGWPARAHIDGRYDVVCPLVARDAGLGDIGRMGLLMTPRLGPRVRIAVVTTDAPLAPDIPSHDESMLDFCLRCNKCADNCPAQAIPTGERIDDDGLARWQIDSDACFLFWNQVGTDCGRCIAVCPYAHPDTLLHNLVRRGIALSSLLRRAAVPLDDLFYGRRPRPLPLQDWIPPRSSTD
ncbi:MAG: 4Fe-4S dicluster domain-containing protein [Bacteroidota bacterium]|nr:4Fe-4S dicluster domain-containing protein [Bacteroidota bacterium]